EVQIDAEDLDNPERVRAFQEAQNEFSGALSRLLVSVEQYPEVRSQENFGRFMTQLEGSENRIRVAIRDYNEAVRQYNTTIRTFPDIIGAKIIHGAKPLTPYEAATEGAEVAPTLNMRSNGAAAPAASNDNAPAGSDAAAVANGGVPAPTMSRLIASLWLLLALLAGSTAAAQPQFPERGTAPVVDLANIIDPAAEAELSARLDAFEQ